METSLGADVHVALQREISTGRDGIQADSTVTIANNDRYDAPDAVEAIRRRA